MVIYEGVDEELSVRGRPYSSNWAKMLAVKPDESGKPKHIPRERIIEIQEL